MTQMTKKGTLTSPPHAFVASFHQDSNKLKSTVLTEKRADNILFNLNEIRNKNAKDMQHITNRYDSPQKRRDDYLATVIEHLPPSTSVLCQNILVEGSFSEDFRRMLK
jgi:ABC-type Fe3+/spermidine/putrescine transport system ATPase subunit